MDVYEKIYAKNEEMAKVLSEDLRDKKILCVNVLGSPGAGKTKSLIQIIKGLEFENYVIEGDIEGDIDTVKLQELGIKVTQIDTHNACHLDSPQIVDALKDFELEEGIVFIENIGNLICPAEFKIGEHLIMLVTAVTDGSDKPYKYPLAFQKANIILVNKTDLQPYTDFDAEFFTKGVRYNNKTAPIFYVNAKTGEGFEDVRSFLVDFYQEFTKE
ncbi:MAG: hydrogenase nickel incorporation protein HypB [Oscillospiraceae bacterium]|jgi:hydrogenase nickel incorporation protein HypB|nr:hydrogenase nickel incorporation protein HypB [Oscillospiraceae bacterium]